MPQESVEPGGLILLGGDRMEVDRVRALGVPALIVSTSDRVSPGDIEHADRTLVVPSFDDPALVPMLHALHRVTPFTACVSMTETGLAPAARVNARLGLPGVSVETVEATRDKARMRELLADHGVAPVAARLCADPDEAVSFIRECGLPAVLKPVDGVGSRGVRLARSEAEAREAAEALLGTGSGKGVLVEEFLDGPEFSVETFTVGGEHTVLAVVAKTLAPGSFVELGHATPAPGLGEQDREEIGALVRAALDAVGLTGGPGHTEVKLTPRGPRVVEMHTRVGGDYIPFLVRMTTGLDLFEMTLAWAAGLLAPVEDPVVPRGGAAIHFLAPPPGRVVAVHGQDRVVGMPGVVDVGVTRRPGDAVPALAGSGDRSGHVLTAAETAVDAVRIGIEALGHLVVETVAPRTAQEGTRA